MARQIDEAKRAQLIADAADYLSRHGVVDTSLRTLATALGTTARMLVYYFGTKEALFVAALDSQRHDFADLFAHVDDLAALRTTLHTLWHEMTVGSKESGARILLQVLGAACSGAGDYRPYVTVAIENLTATLQAALERSGLSRNDATQHAILIGAAFRGLLLDRFTSADPADADTRARAALDVLIAAVAAKYPA